MRFVIAVLAVFVFATPAPAEEVLWDLTHGVYVDTDEDYHPDADYSDLLALLESIGYYVSTTEDGIANAAAAKRNGPQRGRRKEFIVFLPIGLQ